MKTFKGKAIYSPSGKAGEYSYWACNFYRGCSGGCHYCYLKKGIGKKILGGDVPVLKDCFEDPDHGMQVFRREMNRNICELQEFGLFFSFTTDPCLPETWELTWRAIEDCLCHDVPVKLLTKQGDVQYYLMEHMSWLEGEQHNIAVGFTLTGKDELEPGGSPNHERIAAMKRLYDLGFKTWASIEPVIDVESSLAMIQQCRDFCHLFKIGMESGKKYPDFDYAKLVVSANCLIGQSKSEAKVYYKESVLKKMPNANGGYCSVGRDYNVFLNK